MIIRPGVTGATKPSGAPLPLPIRTSAGLRVIGFVAPVTPGRIIIEAEGVPYEVAKEALRLAAQKLPVTTKFIVRRDYDAQNQNA